MEEKYSTKESICVNDPVSHFLKIVIQYSFRGPVFRNRLRTLFELVND